MATSIKGKFLIIGTNLIQAAVTPQDAAAGKILGEPIGVQVTVQSLDAPTSGAPPAMAIQWPFYQDGAGEILTAGATVELTVTRVTPPTA